MPRSSIKSMARRSMVAISARVREFCGRKRLSSLPLTMPYMFSRYT